MGSLLLSIQCVRAQISTAMPALEKLDGITRQLSLKPLSENRLNTRFTYALTQDRPAFPQLYVYVKSREHQEESPLHDLSLGVAGFKHLASVTLQGAVSYDRFRRHLLTTMTEGEDIRTLTTLGGLNIALTPRAALSLTLTVSRAHALQTTTTGQIGLLHRWSERWTGRVGLSVLRSSDVSAMVSVSVMGLIDP
jgi:hypothetical protein